MKCKIINFTQVSELDGELVFFESSNEIPFDIKRVFYIFNVPNYCERANHASVNSKFVLVAIRGSVNVYINDGQQESVYQIDKPNMGLYIPKMTWMRTQGFSNDAVLMVLTDTNYNDCKYIEDYKDFCNQVNKER